VRRLHWTAVLLGTLALLGLVLASILDTESMEITPPLSGGSNERGAFRIGVLGDAQKGLANLRNIMRAVVAERVRMMFQTGDLVASNDEGHYRLALRYWRRGGGFQTPAVAPGNHDIKGGTELFRKYCMPLEWGHVEGDVAIVVLNNAFGNPPPDPNYVEGRIAGAGSHKATILLMHQAPFDLHGNPKPEYAAFLAWLEKSKIAYLLCGHEHVYLKKKVGDTTVIINGVGGDYDKWQLDQKVYATILDVDGARITDRCLEIDPAHEIWENIDHFLVGHVAESYRRKPVLCWFGTLLLIGGVGWGWVKLFCRKVTV
jgi:predicted phosphodiesterase